MPLGGLPWDLAVRQVGPGRMSPLEVIVDQSRIAQPSASKRVVRSREGDAPAEPLSLPSADKRAWFGWRLALARLDGLAYRIPVFKGDEPLVSRVVKESPLRHSTEASPSESRLHIPGEESQSRNHRHTKQN